jgi:hypothetical protein
MLVPRVSAMDCTLTWPVAAEPTNGCNVASALGPGERGAVKITAPACALPGRYGLVQFVLVIVTLDHGPDRSGKSFEKLHVEPLTCI